MFRIRVRPPRHQSPQLQVHHREHRRQVVKAPAPVRPMRPMVKMRRIMGTLDFRIAQKIDFNFFFVFSFFVVNKRLAHKH